MVAGDFWGDEEDLTLRGVRKHNKQIFYFPWYVKILYTFLTFNCYTDSLRLI